MSDGPPISQTWDAGELACGPMLLELKKRLERMAPGETIRVLTLDAGAPVDVPAWCRLTGHLLREAAHPRYEIQRRDDQVWQASSASR